jgi:phytol kinase
MKQDLLPLLYLSSMFIALFAVGEILFHFEKVKAEYTRKFIHAGTGLLTMLFPIYFSNPLSVIIICTSFLILLSLSLKFNFLKAINAIDRKSHGSILYPIIVVITYLFYHYQSQNCSETESACYFYFYLPILIMALADPCAALVGKATRWIPYTVFSETKSLSGSLAFFVVAFIISYLFLGIDKLIFVFIITFLSTITEGIGTKGIDNFTIPLSVILGLWWM